MLRNAYLDGINWAISFASVFSQHCPRLTTTHNWLIKTSCKGHNSRSQLKRAVTEQLQSRGQSSCTSYPTMLRLLWVVKIRRQVNYGYYLVKQSALLIKQWKHPTRMKSFNCICHAILNKYNPFFSGIKTCLVLLFIKDFKI